MEMMTKEKQELSPKQRALLKSLTVSEVPPVPRLDARLLNKVPFWIRWVPLAKALSISVLLGGMALLFHPVIPEILQGPIPLKNGSSLELLAGKTWRIPLPSAKGWMVLDGPAALELVRAGRSVPSGRFEAEMILERGDLFLQVHSGVSKLIQIKTPLLTVRVTGTELLVGHQPEQGSRVLVVRGAVEVKTADNQARWEPLNQGLVLRVDPKGIASREPLKREELRNSDYELWNEKKDSSDQSRIGNPKSTMKSRSILWHEN